MNHSINKPVIFLAVIFITASLFFGCGKKGPADALVTVIDSAGKAVQGATVVLKQDSVISPTTGAQANVYQSQVTDFNGQSLFTFPLEVVLNAEISKGSLLVRDYIRLEQSKRVEKTFVLK